MPHARSRIALLALALCGAGTEGCTAADGSLSGSAIVLDGDTLRVKGTLVGLHGITAPGPRQTCETRDGRTSRCGAEAGRQLADRIGSGDLSCEARGTPDRAGRTLAVCRLDGEDLAAWMVSHGLAVADRTTGTDYAAAEDRAWARRTGLWAGVFEHPAGRARPNYATAGMLASR